MPGWIIQGVRGEGKSLCAVARAKEYLLRGCPVATNLDLYLDELLPDDNQAIAYRLPDKPSIEHFQALPPAYDRAYKNEDKNGLIILDEIGLWLNCRNWLDKGRQEIINWLLLSRKNHWDLILLVQDHEMVDNQIKTTLCDYLVQASRTDRQKIPYLGSLLSLAGFSGMFPKLHIYDVYYGFSGFDRPQYRWKYRGHDLYAGYDTNQIFTDGKEVIEVSRFGVSTAKVVDFRAIYAYLPASYLANFERIRLINEQIAELKAQLINSSDGVSDMAKRKTVPVDNDKLKIVFLSLALVGFLVYNFAFKKTTKPDHLPVSASVSAPAQVDAKPTQASVLPVNSFFNSSKPLPAPKPEPVVSESDSVEQSVSVLPVKKEDFLSHLMSEYKPRLSAYIHSEKKGDVGIIEFYQGSQVVERFTFEELHALKVAVVVKKYGVDLVTDAGAYPVTSWVKQSSQQVQPQESIALNRVQ